MKKMLSIATIVALFGLFAIGCSTPEESGKTGETTTTAGAGSDHKTTDPSDAKTDSKTDEHKEEGK